MECYVIFLKTSLQKKSLGYLAMGQVVQMGPLWSQYAVKMDHDLRSIYAIIN